MKKFVVITLCAFASLNASAAIASDDEQAPKSILKKSSSPISSESDGNFRPKKKVDFTGKKDIVYFGNEFKKDAEDSYIHSDKTPYFHSGKTQFEYSKQINEEKRECIDGADLDAPLKWMEKFDAGRQKTRKEEFLDKAEEERKYREEKEANATKSGGHINYALVLAQKVEDNARSPLASFPEFTDGSARWKTLGKPYRDAARALLLCVDDELTTPPDVATTLHARYMEITKMMAELYFKLSNETIPSYHAFYVSLLLLNTALIQGEEFDFSNDLLSKMKVTLPERRTIIHQHTERLSVEKLPEDPSTCVCEDYERSIDELLQLLDWVKLAKAEGRDYHQYIEAELLKKHTMTHIH